MEMAKPLAASLTLSCIQLPDADQGYHLYGCSILQAYLDYVYRLW